MMCKIIITIIIISIIIIIIIIMSIACTQHSQHKHCDIPKHTHAFVHTHTVTYLKSWDQVWVGNTVFGPLQHIIVIEQSVEPKFEHWSPVLALWSGHEIEKVNRRKASHIAFPSTTHRLSVPASHMIEKINIEINLCMTKVQSRPFWKHRTVQGSSAEDFVETFSNIVLRAIAKPLCLVLDSINQPLLLLR